MEPHREVEIRLRLAPGVAAAFDGCARAIGATAAQQRARRLNSTYFDTPAGDLRRAGLSLRIRDDGSRLVQTIKAGSGGLVRGEWEQPVEAEQPDLRRAAANEALSVLHRDEVVSALAPVFAVDVERATWRLRRGASVVEISRDVGTIRAGQAQTPVCEVEFELKSGDPTALLDAVRALGACMPGLISLTGKADRGYRLIEDRRGSGAGYRPVSVGDDAEAAIRAIGAHILPRLFDELDAIAKAHRPQAIHRARVWARRLRALIALFAPLVMPDGDRRLADELRWLAGRLGDVRDRDVFDEERLRPALATHPASEALAGFATRFATSREQAYEALAEDLRSLRCLDLCLHLVATFEGLVPRQGTQDTGNAPLLPLLAVTIDKRLGKLLRSGRHLRRKSEDDLHQLRLRAKKLRYLLEPFAGLAPKKRHARMLEALETIQAELGAINDSHVARNLIAADGGDDAERLAGLLGADDALHLRLGKAGRALRKLRRIKPFWRKWAGGLSPS